MHLEGGQGALGSGSSPRAQASIEFVLVIKVLGSNPDKRVIIDVDLSFSANALVAQYGVPAGFKLLQGNNFNKVIAHCRTMKARQSGSNIPENRDRLLGKGNSLRISHQFFRPNRWRARREDTRSVEGETGSHSGQDISTLSCRESTQ